MLVTDGRLGRMELVTQQGYFGACCDEECTNELCTDDWPPRVTYYIEHVPGFNMGQRYWCIECGKKRINS